MEERVQEVILNGRYRLGQLIGEGGMAVVYLGRDLLLNREVAIKILRDQYASDENFLKRFEREGQIAAGMTHPNIVSVYDVGHDDSQHYIVMEYIRGPNLKELIHRQGPFSVDGAVFIISQVASALDYAHQRGLVHRDIKPQNILVDRNGNAKVVDFGIAKGMRDPSLTEAGTGMGTVHYVSPEQARGGDIGPASDLYSTGVVLFEMLTRALPFDADTPVGVAMHHVNTPPPRPSSINPDIPPQIDAIVLRALAKDPSDRFPSGAALEMALRYWDAPGIQQTHQAPSPRPQPRQRPASGSGSARPPVQRRRRRRPASARPPAPPMSGGSPGVGCGTWIIGALMLALVVGIVLAALEFGPDFFESAAQEDATPTMTAADATPTEPVSVPPTNEPTDQPTATSESSEPTATSDQPSSPTETPSPTEPAMAAVPNLLDLTIPQARVEVTGVWDLEILDESSTTTDEGLIMRQRPSPGIQLAEGETITVWVSTGPDIVDIPDLVNTPADQAVATLESLGLDVEVVEEPSQEIAEGDVVAVEPADTAPAGSTVTLTVSMGDVVIIPDLFGVDVFIARDRLEEQGLVVRNVIPRGCDFLERVNPAFICDDVNVNEVVAISSGPDPLTWGDVVPRGTSVDLVYLQAIDTP